LFHNKPSLNVIVITFYKKVKKKSKNVTIKKMFMKKELKIIVNPLLEWYQKEKRDLPWRHTKDSYKIWISEIMLQQTRVEAVKEYYERFLKELPTLKDLATVDEDKLLKLWEGLGYYSRARNLKKCAETLIKNNQTELPRNYDELKSLPGIGPYAAGSIGSIAYDLKTPAIDGNVLRVMTRIYEDDRNIMNSQVRREYFQKIQEIMPADHTRDFTESLMELGALVCVPNGAPTCLTCPLNFCCQSYQHGTMLQYPVKKKSAVRKIEEKTIIILEYNGKYAIQKRPDTGLLASMYEFFSIPSKLSEEELEMFLEEHDILSQKVYNLGILKHIFSHIEWHMVGYHVVCQEKPEQDFIWASKKELTEKYSLPNAYIKYIQKMDI